MGVGRMPAIRDVDAHAGEESLGSISVLRTSVVSATEFPARIR